MPPIPNVDHVALLLKGKSYGIVIAQNDQILQTRILTI